MDNASLKGTLLEGGGQCNKTLSQGSFSRPAIVLGLGHKVHKCKQLKPSQKDPPHVSQSVRTSRTSKVTSQQVQAISVTYKESLAAKGVH